MGIWPNSTGMVPGWSLTEIVQMVLIGCISRSLGKKVGFQNAFFKNLLVWNYKAQIFHIYYIALSRRPIPKLFKLCPFGQNRPRPGGHNFTLNYIRKSSNDFFSWTARLSPMKIVQMVLIGCISRSRGQKIGFQNAIFKNLLVWN